MKKLNSIIRELQASKYKNSLEDFLINEKYYMENKSFFYNDLKLKIFDNKIISDDLYLKLKKYKKKNEEDKILIYYKKFNIFLNLKSKYANHKSVNLKNANLKTILFLCKITLQVKKLNVYQRLNYLLKVNDYFILNYKPRQIDNETKLLALFLFEKEKNYIKRINHV